MKISQIIKNITEIQDPLWVANLSDEEIERIEDNFYLVWMKLKLINDIDITKPLLEISQYLTAKKILDGKLVFKNKRVDFRTFYSLCIDVIPKKKYKFIYPKKKKKNDYDYEFLKLMAKDLGESVSHCEDFYDIYEELGILEKKKVKLFNKYGIEYQSKTKETTEIVNIGIIKEHPKSNRTKSRSKEYSILLEKIKAFGLLEPIIVEKKTNYIVSGNMRYRCYKELGNRKIKVIKRKFKFDVIDLINFQMDKGKLLSERVKQYHKLNQELKKHGYKERKKLMGGILKRNYLFQETGISQTLVNRLENIENKDKELYNKVLKEEISVSKAFLNIKNKAN